MHTLFAILFAFASVLGPWLCCCAPMRFLAECSTPVEVDAEYECPFCKTAKPEAPKPERKHPCPCTTQPLPEMVATDVKAVTVSDVASPVHLTIYVVPLESVGIDAVVAAVVANELPFLPAKTRLRVHHVMHC